MIRAFLKDPPNINKKRLIQICFFEKKSCEKSITIAKNNQLEFNEELVIGNKLSGTYVSEITSNHVWYFTKANQNLIVTLEIY